MMAFFEEDDFILGDGESDGGLTSFHGVHATCGAVINPDISFAKPFNAMIGPHFSFDITSAEA